MKSLLLFILGSLIFAFVLQSESRTQTPNRKLKSIEEAELRTAATKAIKLIQRAQSVWYQKETCTSCHHQLLPQIPFSLARERGVQLDEKAARETTATSFAFLKDLDSVVQGYDYIDVMFDGWALTTASRAGIRPSPTTDAEAQFIASRQLPDGSWPTVDDRPPQSSSLFTVTAVCAEAVRQYMPERFNVERETRLRLARQWFLKAQPRTTEDRTFQLFGLKWARADQDTLKKAARRLIAEQREDGGWSQLPSLSSDAYSTGEALVALRDVGAIETGDPAYQRGLRFLLGNQQSDGSWVLKSRLHPPAPVSPPYVNTEFPPFQHDQFISIMATSWAASALLEAVPSRTDIAKQPALADIAPTAQEKWIHVALNGSTAELRKLLDAGMNANAKTAQGTSALMLAARDLEKVKLLIDRGADVDARSAAGVTPLMVAARYRGNVEVVRLLLKKEAKVIPDKSVEVRNDASALFFAAAAGDVQTVSALLDAGAKVDQRMTLLGQFSISPLNYTISLGDPALIDYLISKGADPNEVDNDQISMLSWATIANQGRVVQALLARGAKVNHVDKFGMTPLLYAAS
ncbi:MAG TPA: ankyrin repeat domain-containing protein, partial [Blastocatellia bacterium]